MFGLEIPEIIEKLGSSERTSPPPAELASYVTPTFLSAIYLSIFTLTLSVCPYVRPSINNNNLYVYNFGSVTSL